MPYALILAGLANAACGNAIISCLCLSTGMVLLAFEDQEEADALDLEGEDARDS